MEYDKPYEPIKEHRPPETSAEKHFAYLNSEEGEEEFEAHFGGDPMSGWIDSQKKEITENTKKEIYEKINKLEEAIYELEITSNIIYDLVNSQKVNASSSYILVLSRIKDIISTNKSGSINSQVLIEKANAAKKCITALREINKITNNSNLIQIVEILEKNSNEFKTILKDLKSKLD